MTTIDDLTISLFVLIGVRFIAFLFFLQLFLRQRESQYAVLSLCWLSYLIGPVFGLQQYFTIGNIEHPLFGYSAAVGTFLLMTGITLYYRRVSLDRLIVMLSLVISGFGAMIIFFPVASGILAITSQSIFILVTLIIVLFKRKWFISFGSENSYYWLILTLILALLHAVGFLLYFSWTPLSVRFFITFLINLCLIMFFMHFDRDQSFKRLSTSEKKHRGILEGLNDAAYRMSLPDGKYEYFSPVAKSVFGCDSKEWLNTDFHRH